MSRNNAQDALELVELSWCVFPLHTWNVDHCDCNVKGCPNPAKHPRTRHGLLDASTELAQVIEWWKMWPAANIGVRTGEVSGIVVVDVDIRHGGKDEWIRLLGEHKYEHDGPACLTGSGGMHLYFEHPGTEIRNSASLVAPGIDIRGDGGYVIAPPSIHQLGTSYAWIEGYEPWTRTPKEIPGWLLEAMQQRPKEGAGSAPPVAAKIPSGKRRAALLSLAGTMRQRNMGETAIFNALMAENAEKCEPPLDAREVAALAADVVARYEPQGAYILPSTKTNKEKARARAMPEPKTFASLKDKELPPTRWAVPGLLPQGLAMLAGAPKLGKSYLALALCFDVGRGEEACDFFPTEESDCLYLALEDGEARLKRRSKEMLGSGAWPIRAYYETQWPRVGEGGREVLEAWLGQHPDARLVVIDTFALFKPENVGGRKGDVYAEDYAAVRAVKEIADQFSVCVLVITHVNKGAHEDWVNTMTGSTGLSGAADTLLNMARPEGQREKGARDEAVLRLTGRDVEEDAWFMRRKEGWWKITGDAEDEKEAREQDNTVHFMQVLYEDGFTEVTPAMLAKVSNRKAGTAQQALGRAYGADRIIRVRQGVYALKAANTSEIPTSNRHETDTYKAMRAKQLLFTERDSDRTDNTGQYADKRFESEEPRNG